MKMDEYRTSQICPDCDQRRLNNVPERHDSDGGPGQNIHDLVKCNNCKKCGIGALQVPKHPVHVLKYDGKQQPGAAQILAAGIKPVGIRRW
jgi:hypothetical protein